MKNKQITILATDFKPMTGGVAEYSFHLADNLYKQNLLYRVITPVIQTKKYSFKVDAPQDFNWSKSLKNHFFLLSKFYSLLYLAQLRLIEVKNILQWLFNRRHTFLIVNWIASPLAQRWISILQKLNLDYGIVLHGKDIIVASKTDKHFFTHTCTKAKLLIFNSQATKKLFQELQPSIKTSHYILYPGININYLNQENLHSREDLEKFFNISLQGKLIISTVSRLVKRKGIDLAIRAIEPIAKKNQDLIYIIMGDGNEYESLKALIASLGLENQVKLVGNLTDREKLSLLKISSIFIMPNHHQQGDDFEGFGISFIEASYFKNVVIGGCNGGVVEAIRDGDSGLLVDTKSVNVVKSIQEIIRKLLSNPERIEQMAEWGHQYVIDNFQAPQLINNFAQYILDYSFESFKL
ncbi:MAG: glycosyltransferase family 4 protein [Moorea sp. SIO3G5]|nr:glycosyltransferase family 4 protein [Moorena sp. SIO3G5]